MRRRTFLLCAQRTTVAAALAPLVTRCRAAKVIGPWQGPEPGLRDALLRAASYGLLAASSHNTQPWLLRRFDDELALYVDPERTLPETDPLHRQIYISQGTFLEQLAIGTRSEGFEAQIRPFPTGTTLHDPVAVVSLRKASTTAPDPLSSMILKRSTNKRPYDPKRPIRLTEQGTLARSAHRPGLQTSAYDDPDDLHRLSELCTEAMAVEVRARRRNAETARWFRVSDDEFADHKDGFGLPQSGVTGFRRWIAETFVIRRNDDLVDPDGSFARQSVDLTKEQASSTPVFFAIVSTKNDRGIQVEAGRAYARLQLTATKLGIALQPLSQALQDYDEMASVLRRTKEALGVPSSSTVQMLVRAGFAEAVVHAPRRPVQTLLRQG